MRWRDLPVRNRVLVSVALSALAVILLSIFIILASVEGTGFGVSGFEEAVSPDLPGQADIAGWASFDKDSYLPGETARYRIRVLWRKDIVVPDLETFQSSISFFPFDHKAIVVNQRRMSGGIREYVADYLLQPVNVDTTESYLLPTATLYYTFTRHENAGLQLLRINPPQLHVGELYPPDISGIPLIETKGEIRDPVLLRQSLITLCGIVLLVLALFLLWRFGRRRPLSTLSTAEQLWQRFHALRPDASDKRQYVLDCERIFTRTLHEGAGISAAVFWSGHGANESDWQDVTRNARSLFGQSYQPGLPTDADISRASMLVTGILEPLVSEAEMRRQQQPSLSMRLRKQPAILATSISLGIFASVLFTLAALPSSWVSTDVLRYNMATRMLLTDETLEQGFNGFSALAKDAEDESVKAASFYNHGVLLTDPRWSGQAPQQQQDLLDAIFLPGITLDQLLHSLELDAEFELLTILTDSARRYVQAEAAMKAAVRLSPDDADIKRNLEILGKIRRALGNTLAQIVREGEKSTGLTEMRQQTIIDLKTLMEIELPEDFAKHDDGKDDTNYFILERF